MQLHHKWVVYISQDVSLHLGPNTVTHWPEEKGRQESGHSQALAEKSSLFRLLLTLHGSAQAWAPGARPIPLAPSWAI